MPQSSVPKGWARANDRCTAAALPWGIEESGFDLRYLLIFESGASPALGLFDRGSLLRHTPLEHTLKSVGNISICDHLMAEFDNHVLEGRPWP
jgi:hypothetical protein